MKTKLLKRLRKKADKVYVEYLSPTTNLCYVCLPYKKRGATRIAKLEGFPHLYFTEYPAKGQGESYDEDFVRYNRKHIKELAMRFLYEIEVDTWTFEGKIKSINEI